MNLRPGSLPRLLVCHSRRAGFSEFWPTIGFLTTASLKWSTTAAMANAPPSRSYRLESVISCLPLEASHGVIAGSFHRLRRQHALPAYYAGPTGSDSTSPLGSGAFSCGAFAAWAGL